MQVFTQCCRFPASPDPKVFAAQQTLVEAWSIIEDAYVDAQFGGHQWEDELSKRSGGDLRSGGWRRGVQADRQHAVKAGRPVHPHRARIVCLSPLSVLPTVLMSQHTATSML